MRAVVVGAGAWGLSAALELADRGHEVSCIDRDGPGNPWSSSSGPTRLWRLADPDPAAIRLGRRASAALERIEARLGHPVHTRTGLLWRDAPEPLRRSLGAASLQPSFSGEGSVRFEIASAGEIQSFNEILVRFHLEQPRQLHSARVAIQRFDLVP